MVVCVVCLCVCVCVCVCACACVCVCVLAAYLTLRGCWGLGNHIGDTGATSAARALQNSWAPEALLLSCAFARQRAGGVSRAQLCVGNLHAISLFMGVVRGFARARC